MIKHTPDQKYAAHLSALKHHRLAGEYLDKRRYGMASHHTELMLEDIGHIVGEDVRVEIMGDGTASRE